MGPAVIFSEWDDVSAKGFDAVMRGTVRRQRIVDAAMAMLEDREFERIQVKDIADGASVALGTVYHYFSSKEHLFGEVLVQWAGSLRTSITRRSLAGADPAARLEDALHRSDGPVAKAAGTASVRGAFFDSVTDRVADAVLDSSLRSWSAGRLPIADVYRSLSDAVALLLGGDRGR